MIRLFQESIFHFSSPLQIILVLLTSILSFSMINSPISSAQIIPPQDRAKRGIFGYCFIPPMWQDAIIKWWKERHEGL